MELLGFIAICFVIWKFVDSLSIKTENKHTVSKTTTIRDNGRDRTVHTVINESFVRGSAHNSINTQNAPSDLSDEEITGMKMLSEKEYERLLAEGQAPKETPSPQQNTANAFGRDPTLQAPPPPPRQIPSRADSRPAPATKRCGKCGKTKPAETEFFKSKKQPDGFSAWCRSCHDGAGKESRHYKRCPKCGNNRLRTNFGRSDKNPDGLTKWCLPCLKKHSRSSSR